MSYLIIGCLKFFVASEIEKNAEVSKDRDNLKEQVEAASNKKQILNEELKVKEEEMKETKEAHDELQSSS